MRSSLLLPLLRIFLVVAAALAACGPSRGDGGDDEAECAPGEERCAGAIHQVCAGGAWENAEVCAGACREDLGGCIDCDPAGGTTCRGNDVVACNADGSFGGVVQTCSAGTACNAGECTRACTADGVDLIYVVDDQYRLLGYDPRRQMAGQDPFTLIGSLQCPASSQPVPGWIGGVTPFSMSVDREGRAWVLYTSGQIFHVDTQNAACAATAFQPSQGSGSERWHLFGMGFVTDEAGGAAERLWIGGGDPEARPGGLFGYVDPGTLAVQNVGRLPSQGEYSPEFTGTGNGELFGFFPGISQAFVQQLDKTTGALTGNRMSIPNGLGGQVAAWAFAHWGGQFYLFVTTQDVLGNSNSTVRRIDRQSGQYQLLQQNLPYVIVGAGVSTCAPVQIE